MRAGALDGLSIGFRAVNGRRDPKTGIRRLAKVDLWEISVVTFPLLPEARVAHVKARLPQRHLRKRIRTLAHAGRWAHRRPAVIRRAQGPHHAGRSWPGPSAASSPDRRARSCVGRRRTRPTPWLRLAPATIRPMAATPPTMEPRPPQHLPMPQRTTMHTTRNQIRRRRRPRRRLRRLHARLRGLQGQQRRAPRPARAPPLGRRRHRPTRSTASTARSTSTSASSTSSR